MWLAEAEYEDGTFVSQLFPYGTLNNESEEQFRIEEWLVTHHDGVTWFSVVYVEDYRLYM